MRILVHTAGQVCMMLRIDVSCFHFNKYNKILGCSPGLLSFCGNIEMLVAGQLIPRWHRKNFQESELHFRCGKG
jgi:hypothetical protein